MVLSWLEANPRAARKHGYGAAQRAVIDPDRVPDVGALLGGGHGPTPLYSLPALAERLGVGEVRVKDESQRFGFGAFKALGGVIAVYDVLSGAIGQARHSGAGFADVMHGKYREVTSRFVFATASSGNHGRSVAAGARLFGNRCFVFLPKFTSVEK